MALSILRNEPFESNEVSVQYLVDCNVYNQGCYKGSMWNAYRYILKKGYVVWPDYASGYLGVQRPCQAPTAGNI
jgi:hypothetical protein